MNIKKMKKSIFLLLILTSISVFSQNSDYKVSSYLTEGTKAPNTHYIGEAWLNAIIQDDEELGYNITKATFKANSTLDWHKHGTAQVLIILEGEAYYQEKGIAPVILKKGDVIKCEKDIEHWHSSTKSSDVTYLALYGGGLPTSWTEVVTQEYYDEVAEKLKSN
jgi:quercetin dioxygenase-like cupin family protein